MAKIWYLQLTRICNNKCVFCSNPENWKILTLQEIKQWLNELKKSWYTEIILTWWEPTIHPNLFEAIQYCHNIWAKPRIITNWMLLSNEFFVKKLKEYNIKIVHISVYTYKEKLNDKLRRTKWAFKKMIKTILNLKKYNITTQITTVICKQNQNHLFKTLLFIKKLNPNITHFVRNILDPLMMPQTKEALNSIPDLNNVTEELLKCFKYLEKIGNTFRIERIPLCKILWYERANTECRKLVKKENRKVIFLDSRGNFEQDTKWFRHSYFSECKECVLYNICPGIYQKEKYYKNVKVKPIKDIKKYTNIIKKFKRTY